MFAKQKIKYLLKTSTLSLNSTAINTWPVERVSAHNLMQISILIYVQNKLSVKQMFTGLFKDR